MRVFILIIALILFSCQREKKADIAKNDIITAKSTPNTKGFAKIIISNVSKDAPVSIFRTKNYYNVNQNLERIISKKTIDTISFVVNRIEKIAFTTKDYIRQETILKPGDIVKVNINDSNLSINSNCNPLKQKNSLELRTLRKNFYKIDSSRPFKPHSTKYEKKAVVYPLNINYSNFKNKEEELLSFIELLIKETEESKSSFSESKVKASCTNKYTEELNLKLFKELCLFYAYSKNEKLKKIITDQFSKVSLNDINLYEKANTFVKRVVLKNEKIKEKFKLKVNYKKAFELSSDYTSLKPKILTYLKYVCINQMIAQKDSKESILGIINKFEKQYPNNFFNPSLEKHKIQLSGTNKIYAEEVLLVDHHNNKTTLEKLLKQNTGNIVYIDLWASWCLPCRYKMSDLKKLKQYYADKKIIFVYLSIDEYEKDWHQASIEEELTNDNNSFLIQNFKSSKFLKSLKINSIPRYLLLDQDGKMINENAPGPDAEELKEIINKKLLQ